MKVNIIYVYLLLLVIILSILFIAYLLLNKAEPEKRIIVIREESTPHDRTPLCHNKTNSNLSTNPTTGPIYPSRHDRQYQLLGTLSCSQRDLILPLFGRRINTDRWQYYTTTDNNRLIRLDIQYNKQSCNDIIGCSEIYNDELVFVPQYDSDFKVALYKYEIPSYD